MRKFFLLLREAVAPYRWPFAAAVVLLLATVVLPLWRIVPLSHTQPFLPLHYNVLVGVDLFGAWYHVFFIPLLGLLFLAVDVGLLVALGNRERALSHVVAAATVLGQVLLAAAMTFVILLNA